MVTEYIKRKDIIKWIDDSLDLCGDRYSVDQENMVELFRTVVNDCLPFADVRPVVYCKECKHRPVEEGRRVMAPKYADGYSDYKCPFLCDDYWYNRMPADDDYCSSGEKREES